MEVEHTNDEALRQDDEEWQWRQQLFSESYGDGCDELMYWLDDEFS